MPKAKKWVLLANAFDDSMMRNVLPFKLADRLGMNYSPDFEFVDLWINGEYRGLYIIGEKVEIGSNRVNLSSDIGAIYEWDWAFYNEEDHWFYDKYLNTYFSLKESVSEDESLINASISDFYNGLDDFLLALYSKNGQTMTIDELSRYIDVDSFAKYYLVNEFTLNYESYGTSFYWYKDGEGDVLHLGPVWDFDTSMYGLKHFDYDDYVADENIMFEALLQNKAFKEYVETVYANNSSAFSSMITDLNYYENSISESADMNFTRWNFLGKENPKYNLKPYKEQIILFPV